MSKALGSVAAFFTLSVSLAASALVSGGNAGGATRQKLATAGSGNSGPVGSSPTISTDLFTGTASTSIAIDSPPGRHGLEPRVTLDYRSTTGNGPVGVGWSLELGAIERRTKGGLDYGSSTPTFVLKSAGAVADLVYDSQAGFYRMKVESAFSRIRMLMASDGHPYWEVTDKSGTKSLYGQTAQSREADPANATHIFRWALDSVQDTHGNFISLQYATNGNRLYPSKIDYTGHMTGATVDAQPNNEIAFQWTPGRYDIQPDYVANFQRQTNQELWQIVVSGGLASGSGQTVSTYQLSYLPSVATGRSLLKTVTIYGKDGVSTLPSSTFQWTAQQAPSCNFEVAANSQAANWSGSPMSRAADFNGDGYDDILLWPDASGSYYLMEGSSLGLGAIHQVGTGTHGSWSDDTTAPSQIFVGDFNGDGKQDLLLGPDTAMDSNNWSGNWFVLPGKADGTGLTAEQEWKPAAYANWWTHAPRIHPLDVDGDGMTDVLIGPDGSNGAFYLLKSTGGTFNDMGVVGNVNTIASIFGMDSLTQDGGAPIYYADATGDGLPDIIIGPSAGGAWYVMVNDGGTFAAPQLWISNAYGGMYTKYAQPLDVDGDGKADMLMGPWDDGTFHELRSTGSSFVDLGSIGTSAYGGTDANRVRAYDMNGDGLPDVMLGPDSSGNWFWMQNVAGTLIDRGSWHTAQGVSEDWDGMLTSGRIRPADIDGDGVMNMVVGPDSNGTWYYDYIVPGRSDLLATVSNGFGATTTLTYQPSTRFTEAQLPFPIYVVTSKTIDDGNGVSATTTYDYSGGYYNTAVQEFRGFAQVVVTGPAWPNGLHNKTTTLFHQGSDVAVGVNTPGDNLGILQGQPYRVKVEDTGGAWTQQTDTTYTLVANGPYYFAPVSIVTSSLIVNGTTSRQSQTQSFYSSDGYGNRIEQDDLAGC